MEENIAYPTDARLYERARQKLVALAQQAGVELRQSYARLAPRLWGPLYEATTVVLTRTSAESALRTRGVKLRERIGFKRAANAVAHKLAVIMHAMLKSGQPFSSEAKAMS